MHQLVVYSVSKHQAGPDNKGSLVDGGSNGGCAGSDVRVILFHHHKRIDVKGVKDQTITNIPCVTCGAYTQTSVGPVIVIMHQYAYIKEGSTIHSKGQLSYYGAKVDDNSMVLGGTQSITLAGGIKLPLDFVNGLPRLPLRPYTDHEFDTLPHIHLTMDKDWDPTVLDKKISDLDTWYDAQQAPTDLPLPGFDIQGTPLLQETYVAHATYTDIQSNLPEHLGPLADYHPHPDLLPKDDDDTVSTQPSSVDSEDDPIDTQADVVAYNEYLAKQHDFEVTLSQALEPEDLIEFSYTDALQDPDAPITGDVLCFHSETHHRLAYPVTRAQARAQQAPRVKPTSAPPTHPPASPPDAELPTDGEPPDGEPATVPPDGEPEAVPPPHGKGGAPIVGVCFRGRR